MITASSSASAGKSTRAKWNHDGQEGKELRKDVMEGINNGTLNPTAPDCMALFNKKRDIYSKVSKGCFRTHLQKYISDYTMVMTMKRPPSASSGGSGILGNNSVSFDDGDDVAEGEMFTSSVHSNDHRLTFPCMVVLWLDKKTTKHITIRMNLPSGCDRRDVTASVQPGGRSVLVKYRWLDLMFDPVKFLDIYNCPSSGRVMYSDECAKFVAIADTGREMKGKFGAKNSSFTSVMEIDLPFQVNEEFTPIRNKIGTHQGLEVLNIYNEERDVWATMLNLEMTGLHNGYTPSVQAIPLRATARKKPALFRSIVDDGRHLGRCNGTTVPPIGGGGCGVQHSRTSVSACSSGMSSSDPCTNANVTPCVSSKRRRVKYDEGDDDSAEDGNDDYND